jgi:DNA-binding beta-propeller fold protein YncE
VILAPWLLACTRPEPPPSHRGPTGDAEAETADTDAGTRDSGDGGASGDTGRVSQIACDRLVRADQITYTITSRIRTEEDFDFDGQGWLLTQGPGGLEGIGRDGVEHLVAPIGGDPTGIRSLADGRIAVAQPSFGTVDLVDPATGVVTVLMTDLWQPNGLEAAEDGRLYVSENSPDGAIHVVDPATGAVELVTRAEYPNGLVLSPDEQTLYYTQSSVSFGGQTGISAVHRDPADGEWDPSTNELVYAHPTYVGSNTIDSCGNLYGVDGVTGKVFRIDTATYALEPLVDLQLGGAFSALHFSPGLAGWDVEALYISTRGDLFELPTGVPGSHVVTP